MKVHLRKNYFERHWLLIDDTHLFYNKVLIALRCRFKFRMHKKNRKKKRNSSVPYLTFPVASSKNSGNTNEDVDGVHVDRNGTIKTLTISTFLIK